jgi:predicted hotdog family 3-hydroxylacyl-ACP dehydratase
MLISKADIESFIPHRAPFVMIDNLLTVQDNVYETDFFIASDNIFLEAGVLREFALIENLAQSSAAGLFYSMRDQKTRPTDGFMGSIAKMELYKLPKAEDKINTTIELLYQFDTMYLLKGANYLNGEKLLECELKLVGI